MTTMHARYSSPFGDSCGATATRSDAPGASSQERRARGLYKAPQNAIEIVSVAAAHPLSCELRVTLDPVANYIFA
jgi:hypothetical protein